MASFFVSITYKVKRKDAREDLSLSVPSGFQNNIEHV